MNSITRNFSIMDYCLHLYKYETVLGEFSRVRSILDITRAAFGCSLLRPNESKLNNTFAYLIWENKVGTGRNEDAGLIVIIYRLVSWGPFLERPCNLTGLKPYFKIKIWRIEKQDLAS